MWPQHVVISSVSSRSHALCANRLCQQVVPTDCARAKSMLRAGPECSDRHFTNDTAECSVCGTELNKRWREPRILRSSALLLLACGQAHLCLTLSTGHVGLCA